MGFSLSLFCQFLPGVKLAVSLWYSGCGGHTDSNFLDVTPIFVVNLFLLVSLMYPVVSGFGSTKGSSIYEAEIPLWQINFTHYIPLFTRKTKYSFLFVLVRF